MKTRWWVSELAESSIGELQATVEKRTQYHALLPTTLLSTAAVNNMVKQVFK